MRVVVFGSGGPLALAAVGAVRRAASLVAVVTPGSPRDRSARGLLRAALRRRGARPLLRGLERSVRRERFEPGGAGALAERLLALRPDLFCLAGFPFRLPASLLEVPRKGCLNLHPSLLPRHRGPDPLFWTYFGDDRETGITLHWADGRIDAGDVLSQSALPVRRGLAVEALYGELASRGAALLERALAEIDAGTAPRIPQDETAATHEPRPDPGAWRIDFETWGAERLWHFLAGLGGRNGRLLHDAAGRRVPHGPGLGYRRERAERPAGSVDRQGSGWRVTCRDGTVDVAGPSWLARAIALLGRGRA